MVLKSLVARFWSQYFQLEAAVQSNNIVLIDKLDSEVEPLLRAIYEAHASDLEDARVQFQFVLDLLEREADDLGSVLRQREALQQLLNRYFLLSKAGGLRHEGVGASPSFTGGRASPEDGSLNEAILECLPDRIAVITPDYRYLYSNSANAARLERRPIELVGRHVVEFVGIQRFETRLKPNLDRCFRGETVDYTASKVAGDRTIVTRCRMTPCPSSTGTVIGAILTLQEIADRRRAIAA